MEMMNLPLEEMYRFSYNKILGYSDKKFAVFYFYFMDSLKSKENLWRDETSTPYCEHCEEEIGSIKDIRRYDGMYFHPRCFKEFYFEEDFIKDNLEDEYWKRVIALEENEHWKRMFENN